MTGIQTMEDIDSRHEDGGRWVGEAETEELLRIIFVPNIQFTIKNLVITYICIPHILQHLAGCSFLRYQKNGNTVQQIQTKLGYFCMLHH